MNDQACCFSLFPLVRERDRERDRQTDRDRDRETERQRQADRQTETETDTEREINIPFTAELGGRVPGKRSLECVGD